MTNSTINFIEYIQNNLHVHVHNHTKGTRMLSEYGSFKIISTPTPFKEYTCRVEGAYVTVVFHPEKMEIKKITCDKRKRNSYYKSIAEQDFKNSIEIWNK